MSKELIIHLPEFPLFAGTTRGFSCFEGIFVNRFERKVSYDIAQLAGINVVFLDLGHRLTDVPATERSLEVGELDHDQFSGFLAFAGCPIDIEHDVLGCSGWSSWLGAQEGFDLLQILLHRLLPILER